MDSADSSPERKTAQQSHAELLKAFQSFKPGRRGPSKTPQPPSTLRTQRSSTPATNANYATRAGQTAAQQESSSTPASTQETTTRKRARRISVEQNEEQESFDSNTPLSQALKHPRQSPLESSVKPIGGSTKQATALPQHIVEVQIQDGLARLGKVASRTLQSIDSIQGEQGRASMTPEVAATDIEGIQGQRMNGAFQYQNPAILFAPQTAQNCKDLANQILNESRNFTETLSQKNGTFLRSVPPTAKSYLENKLAQVTADLTRLHQEKVDGIRLEYVAELQRDMNERQKVIDMLLHKSDA